MIAHNARFDHGFLKNEFRRISASPSGAGAVHGQAVVPPVPDKRHNLDLLLIEPADLGARRATSGACRCA